MNEPAPKIFYRKTRVAFYCDRCKRADRPHHSMGLCNTCYQWYLRDGTIAGKTNPYKKTVAQHKDGLVTKIKVKPKKRKRKYTRVSAVKRKERKLAKKVRGVPVFNLKQRRKVV